MNLRENATTVARLYAQYNTPAETAVTLNGWVRTVRESKRFSFVELHDGTHFKPVQIVFERSKLRLGGDAKISTGCSLRVCGSIVLTPAAAQPFEIHASELEILGACPSGYPLQKKRHSLEFLRTQLHLRPRTNTFQAVFRVRSAAAQAIHHFFSERGFIYVHTPIITYSDCEGAGEMFRVTTLDAAHPPLTPDGQADFSQDFFERETNLTVSGQLYAEAFAQAFSKVYTFGPTFRAEKSHTARHAAEFWMVEPESAFADLSDNMDLAQDMLQYLLAALLSTLPDEMAFFDRYIEPGIIDRLRNILIHDFARMTYTEAITYLQKANVDFEYAPHWGADLQSEHERYLAECVCKRPVFVTDYPKDLKAFYMRQNDDDKTVAAMDLLVPGVGEIIGGSQREERADKLSARLREMDLSPQEYEWYLQLRNYGGCVHSGFGLGFERFIMYVTGMKNIRDVLPFFRTASSATF